MTRVRLRFPAVSSVPPRGRVEREWPGQKPGCSFTSTTGLTFASAVTSLPLRREMGFPGGSDGKVSACSTEDPGSGRSPGVEYSSTLAWKILWTEEPGRLQFMGSQRVRRD